MTGFFAAVVERVLPSAPAVSPRRQPHFQLPAASDPTAAETTREAAVAPARPMSSQARPLPLASAPAAPLHRAVVTPPVAEMERPVLAPRPPSRRPESVEQIRAPRSEPVEQPPAPRIPIPVPTFVPVAEKPNRPIERPTSARRKTAESEEKSLEPKPVRSAPNDASGRRNEAPPVQSIVPSVNRVNREPERSNEITLKRNDAELRTPAPPRIEITIGTVEVRAMIAPPASAPVQRPPVREPAPAVSLNDYLRQRGSSRA